MNGETAVPERLQEIARDGGRWFYVIAGLMVADTTLALSGSTVSFMFGLLAMDLLRGFFAVTESGFDPTSLTWAAAVCVIALSFAALGWAASRGSESALVVGASVYALDGLACLLSMELFRFAFHALVLFFVSRSYLAVRNLRISHPPSAEAPMTRPRLALLYGLVTVPLSLVVLASLAVIIVPSDQSWQFAEAAVLMYAPDDFTAEDRERLHQAYIAVDARFRREGGISVAEAAYMNEPQIEIVNKGAEQPVTRQELLELTQILEYVGGIASPKAEILASGLCVGNGEESAYAQPQSTGGYAVYVRELVITNPTSTVPLEKNIGFGFSWRVAQLPSKVNITYLVEHPLITRPDGTQLTWFEEPMILETVNGILESTDCYFLSEDYELVPGAWSLSIVMNGATLAKQTYQVVESR